MAHQRMRFALAKQACTLRQPQAMSEASFLLLLSLSSAHKIVLVHGAQEVCLDNGDGMYATAACAT